MATYDWEGRSPGETELSAYWALKPKEFGLDVFRLRTRSGLELTATGDHPIYTERGKIPCRELKVGDRVVTRPQAFPLYEEREFVIVTEDEFLRRAPPGTYLGHALRELAKQNLLPFRSLNQPRALALARLVGHLFGDGTLIVKGPTPRAVFRADKEDLAAIEADLRSLGFPPGKIKENNGKGIIHTIAGKNLLVDGKGWSVEARSKPFCALLYALGVPAGDKPATRYRAPQWLLRRGTPIQLKKAFLAAYFGSELALPSIRHGNPGKFRDPIFKISKVVGLENSARAYIQDVGAMLRSLGLGIVSVTQDGGNIRKDGSHTTILAVRLKSSTADLLNLYGRVGYEYNRRAEARARLAYAYLTERSRAVMDRAKVLRRVRRPGKLPYGRIRQIAAETGIPLQTLYGWRYTGMKAAGLKVVADFPSYAQWAEKTTFDRNAGLVLDPVLSKEPAEAPQVYDITTSADTHTFFANGILTNNCPPYNADFDGDEMNLHVLQSEEARAEAKILMKVQEHILSPRFGGPVIGAIHDHITGAFLMTYRDTRFNREEATFLLSLIGGNRPLPPAANRGKAEEYWTGKQLFSLILPEDLNVAFKASIAGKGDSADETAEKDAVVKIVNGHIQSGVIDEKAMGAFKGKIVDKIARDYGPDRARRFIDEATKLAIGTIMLRGFTTGIDDEDIPDEAKQQIQQVLKDSFDRVKSLVEAYRSGELEQMPGRSMEETLEVEVMKVLGRARDQAGQIASRHLGLENSAVIMARSGARGSMLNLSQMAGVIGQQAVRGERISRGYWNRTLPHFREGDLGAEAKGFVKASYKSGLTPTEYFFHSMGGREGLVDTAVRTSRSGYMQRRLINALEDLKVKEDGTVRNTADTVIQFRFGEDGVDPMKSVQGDAVDVDDILWEVLGEEEAWLDKMAEKEKAVAGYGEQEKDLFVEPTEEEVEEVEEEDLGEGE